MQVAFPEDYQAAHLAGKLAVFEVTVRDMQEKLTPLLMMNWQNALGLTISAD